MAEQISFNREILRKLFHLLMLLFPLAYYFLGKWTSLMIMVPATAIMVGIDYYRRTNPTIKFYFEKYFKVLLRQSELDGEKLCGASWFMLATCIIFLICKEEIVITSIAILAICDAAAAIFGRSFGVEPFFEKTLVGSVSFYIFGLFVIFTCGAMFDAKLWFYLFGFFSLFVATMLEARPSLLGFDDNFTIPISFALTMTVFDLMWNYNY